MKTLLVDNYDSFTYNLLHLVAENTGTEVVVVRNDEITWNEFLAMNVDAVILSPGPGRPENKRDFGICRQIILDAKVPVLGVCLGLQGIGQVFGGRIVRAPEPVHGRSSKIEHTGTGLFDGIPHPFEAVRYHSLILDKPVPPCLKITAWTDDGLVMGLEHRERPLFGVQFHPESINSQYGQRLIQNFFRQLPEPRISVKAPQVPTATANRWKVFSRKLDVFPSPEDTFCTLFGNENPAFWLDSSGEGRQARFSYMGTGSLKGTPTPDFEDIDAQLRERHCVAPELPFDFNGGFVGYFGYELKNRFVSDRTTAHRSPHPDAGLIFVDRFLVFDHEARRLYLVFAGPPSDAEAATAWLDSMERRVQRDIATAPNLRPSGETICFELEQNRDQYVEGIIEAQRLISEGESYEICLTNRLIANTETDPLDYYRVLRKLNPAPYSAFLRLPGPAVACSSPELFLRVGQDRTVESRPIKGTLRRSGNPEEDLLLRDALAASLKNRSENLMIVDLLRNDLGRVCEIGSVHVPQMMEVETYTNLHQLVSTIRGRLRPDVTAIDCLQSAFPGGSMTGAPKYRTMELIDQLESSARGIYSGAIGFLGLNGSATLNIVIRTAVFSRNQVCIGIGGAIVALSDPAEEFEEALLKGRALIDAFRPLVEAGSVNAQ